jgi:hypothetical protein
MESEMPDTDPATEAVARQFARVSLREMAERWRRDFQTFEAGIDAIWTGYVEDARAAITAYERVRTQERYAGVEMAGDFELCPLCGQIYSYAGSSESQKCAHPLGPNDQCPCLPDARVTP